MSCWGDDFGGQLADGGALAQSASPVAIPSASDVVQIAAGDLVCALRADATVLCWGNFPNLGSYPAHVPALSNVIAMAPKTSAHECFVIQDGSVKCWGHGETGQLGDGRTGNLITADVPVTVPGISAATAVAVGSYTSCALLVDRTVVCWGGNTKGALGAGTGDPLSLTPISVSGLTDAVQLSLGGSVGCAVRGDGSIQCWGDNSFGELGNGTTVDASIPVAVTGISNAISVAVGDEHVCAELADHTFTCWGGNQKGGLGTQTATLCPQGPCSTAPIAAPAF